MRLSYTYYKNCKDILLINLPNGYTIVALKLYNKVDQTYTVEFRIKASDVDKWDLMHKYSDVFFNETPKDINPKILKWVSSHYSDGKLDEYFEMYDYELACFDYGNFCAELNICGE